MPMWCRTTCGMCRWRLVHQRAGRHAGLGRGGYGQRVAGVQLGLQHGQLGVKRSQAGQLLGHGGAALGYQLGHALPARCGVDVGQAVQLRQLHTGLDELRSDLAGLRRAVLEVPELQRLTEEVTAVRGDLSLLFDVAGDGEDHTPTGVLGELEDVVGRLSAEVGRLGEGSGSKELAFLVDEVAAVRSEVAALAKRPRTTVRLEPDQLRLIADAVTSRLLEELEAGSRRGRRK